MADIKRYWTQVRAKELELREKYGAEGCFFAMPVTTGDCTEVSIEIGARLLVEGTHRESTAAERETFKRHTTELKMISDAQTLRNSGTVRLILSRGPEAVGRK